MFRSVTVTPGLSIGIVLRGDPLSSQSMCFVQLPLRLSARVAQCDWVWSRGQPIIVCQNCFLILQKTTPSKPQEVWFVWRCESPGPKVRLLDLSRYVWEPCGKCDWVSGRGHANHCVPQPLLNFAKFTPEQTTREDSRGLST